MFFTNCDNRDNHVMLGNIADYVETGGSGSHVLPFLWPIWWWAKVVVLLTFFGGLVAGSGPVS